MKNKNIAKTENPSRNRNICKWKVKKELKLNENKMFCRRFSMHLFSPSTLPRSLCNYWIVSGFRYLYNSLWLLWLQKCALSRALFRGADYSHIFFEGMVKTDSTFFPSLSLSHFYRKSEPQPTVPQNMDAHSINQKLNYLSTVERTHKNKPFFTKPQRHSANRLAFTHSSSVLGVFDLI